MAKVETSNLIDLSIEESSQKTPKQTLKENEESTLLTATHPSTPMISMFPSVVHMFPGRTSLDNNPFDCVQNLADRADDPFDIVTEEASHQPKPYYSSGDNVSKEVNTDILLSLSDDNMPADTIFSLREPLLSEERLHTDDKITTTASANLSEVPTNIWECPKLSNCLSSFVSSYQHTLELESPPATVSATSSQDTIESGTSGDSAGSSAKSAGNRRAIEWRKRLLKLSLSNSTFNSPVSRRTSLIGCNSGAIWDEHSSPISVFSEAENIAGQLSAGLMFPDSPKSVEDSCDDLMSIKPNWVDSETDIDTDLEMMTIPILQKIGSPKEEEEPTLPEICDFTTDVPITDTTLATSPKVSSKTDLKSLREKVNLHRKEANNNEISTLIQSLKSVIRECSNDRKKQEAIALLETLSTVLNETKDEDTTKSPSDDSPAKDDTDKTSTLTPPQPIVRQGTFDIDLKEKEDRKELEQKEQDNPKQLDPAEVSLTHSTHSTHSVQFVQDEGEIMSGISLGDDEDIHNKHWEQSQSQSQHSQNSILQTDVSDIVEQIGKLLGNQVQNINVVQANLNGTTVGPSGNPTYIVVMGTPMPACKQRSALVSNMLNSTDDSPEFNDSSQMRRRSQSLSIHDKSKVVQFATPELQVGQLVVSSAPTPIESDFKTPSRLMRRNSFSNATPQTMGYGPSVRRSVFSNSQVDFSKQPNHSRRSSILETHHEQQHTAAAPRSSQVNLNSFKPELNANKLKFKSSTDSIMKSSAPLKATIPIKKVAPMIMKTAASPPAEETRRRSASEKPITSTPMCKGYLNVNTNTTLDSSPVKRTGSSGYLYKPRYSYVPPTPNPKSSSNLAASSTSQIRRRTLSDLKAKSPKLKHGNISGGQQPSTGVASSGISKQVSRTIKLPQNFSRTLNKLAPVSTSTAKPKSNTRLSSRAPVEKLPTIQKNKENKRP